MQHGISDTRPSSNDNGSSSHEPEGPMEATSNGHPRLSVLLVDGDRLFADSVRLALEVRGIHVVAAASSSTDAIELAQRLIPDVVLVEVLLPDGDGIDTGRDIAQALPETAVVAVSSLTDQETVGEAFRAGFSGYVPKGSSLTTLIQRIESAAAGEIVMPREVRGMAAGRGDDRDHAAMLSRTLTGREQQILALIVEGVSGPAIAEQLGLKRNTVRTHVQNILTKLQVSSRLEAAAFAVRHDLVPTRRRNRTHTSA